MALTLGFTGMDPATESALQAAFAAANSRLGGRWQLAPEQDADVVVVDMDSMYGPMSWLRLHSNGKRVVGLTSAPRTQTDFRLGRPIDAEAMAELLAQLDGGAQPDEQAATRADALPAGMTPAPQPFDQLPEELPAHAVEEAEPQTEPLSVVSAGTTVPTAPEPPSVAVGQILPAAPSIAPHVPTEAPPAPAAKTLLDWLRPGHLLGRRRFERGGTVVLIDAEGQQYIGPTALKPLAGLFDGEVSADDFQPLDGGEWERQSATLGSAQPLSRLLWFGALLSGHGRIMPGMDPAGRYRLNKWPQTEREFPKHFRIATAMMKGPATLAEIAEASSVPVEDVADFVNASLATGFAEPERDTGPEPEAPKPGGLFGRLRGR